MLEEVDVRNILKKANLVKYCYASCLESEKPLWCANYIDDDVDRNCELDAIMGYNFHPYDLKRKVYLYKAIRNQFRLIAIISKKGIKLI